LIFGCCGIEVTIFGGRTLLKDYVGFMYVLVMNFRAACLIILSNMNYTPKNSADRNIVVHFGGMENFMVLGDVCDSPTHNKSLI